MSRARLEAFSDGVLAVAITLLILNLHVDIGPGRSLASQLAAEWPSFVAYVVGFLVIGVIWVNHHSLMRLAATVDRTLLFFNLVLLLFVTAIPFTTATIASALAHGTSADMAVASVLYGGVMTGMALAFTTLFARITRDRLAAGELDRASRRRAIVRFGAGTVIYPVVAVVGIWSAPAMLLVYGGLSVYYLFNQTGTPETGTPETGTPETETPDP